MTHSVRGMGVAVLKMSWIFVHIWPWNDLDFNTYRYFWLERKKKSTSLIILWKNVNGLVKYHNFVSNSNGDKPMTTVSNPFGKITETFFFSCRKGDSLMHTATTGRRKLSNFVQITPTANRYLTGKHYQLRPHNKIRIWGILDIGTNCRKLPNRNLDLGFLLGTNFRIQTPYRN